MPKPLWQQPRAQAFALLWVGLCAAVVIHFLSPNAAAYLPACPLKTHTGLLCAGCGSTRACTALLRADIPTAFSHNPFLVLSLPALALMLGRRLWTAVHKNEWRSDSSVTWLGWVWLAALIIYMIARNIPHPWLAPLRP